MVPLQLQEVHVARAHPVATLYISQESVFIAAPPLVPVARAQKAHLKAMLLMLDRRNASIAALRQVPVARAPRARPAAMFLVAASYRKHLTTRFQILSVPTMRAGEALCKETRRHRKIFHQLLFIVSTFAAQ